ncbi:MAG: hypothetical protein CMG84_08915 [Marinobacter sp.]|uniref:Uncharacterized protein n=1 Tax=Marinobacter nauticus TaxID=2743 RepID=A0A833N962_MARNT|nr:hypothetical protein F6453_3604 [Marinobacter nauticus]MAL33528.1 hypothetical protein [Marinobacter sp.]
MIKKEAIRIGEDREIRFLLFLMLRKKIENVLVRIYNLLAITQVSIPITVLAMMLGKFKTKIRLTQKLFSPVTGGGIIVRFVS